jgi:predicted permease
MRSLLADSRYAFRLFRKSPAFTLLAVIALALGIGANTAIFSVVNAVLVRALPYQDPGRLVMVWERPPGSTRNNVVQSGNFLDWRTRNRVFERIAAIHQLPMNLSGDGDPEQVFGLRVSAGFFPILGVAPILGRPIAPEDDTPGGPRSVVLSYGLWQRRFGGDPAAVGRKLEVIGVPHTVVGVMPPGFSFPGMRAELWIPIQINPASAYRDGRNYRTVARLRPGVTLEAAQSEMERIARDLAAERPKFNARWSAGVTSLKDQAVGDVRLALQVLMGAVVFVLLIACANVANLLLMRAAGRRREMAVRCALGAGQGALVRQLLVESVWLAGVGGLLGLVIARWGVPAMMTMLPPSLALPRATEIGVDGAVLAFTLCVCLAAGVVFGLVPALQAARMDVQDGLRQGGRAATGGQRRLRHILVIAEVAIALILVIGAGLMTRSFLSLENVDPGFRPARILALRMFIPPARHLEPQQRAELVNRILERVRALPNVQAAASVHLLPLTGMMSGTGYYRADRPEPEPGHAGGGEVAVISPGFFRTMGIRLLQGRDFEERDRLGSQAVVILNETCARAFYSGENPLGKRLKIMWTLPEAEIIGIVGDVRMYAVESKPGPAIYLANAQTPNFYLSLVVRTLSDPMKLAAAVKAEIRAVDPNQGVLEARSMESVFAESIARPRFNALLLGLFGAIALALACVGIYGVISYSVEQRRREMGVRMAIGALPGAIFGLVLKEGLALAGIGIAIGLASAFALTRYLASLLFGVEPTDPGVFASVCALLTATAIVACYFPARRATRTDPVLALRDE